MRLRKMKADVRRAAPLLIIIAALTGGGECSMPKFMPLAVFVRMGLRGGGETRGLRGELGRVMVDAVRKSRMATESNEARWERLQREDEELKVKEEERRRILEEKRQRKREERKRGSQESANIISPKSRGKRPRQAEAQRAPNISAMLDARNVSYAGADRAYEEGCLAAQGGRVEDAAMAFVSAHRLQPKNASMGFAAGCALHEVGDADGAFKMYEQMLSSGIVTAEILCGFANLMRDCADMAAPGGQVKGVDGSDVGVEFTRASKESCKDERDPCTEEALSIAQGFYEDALNLSSYKDLDIANDYAAFLADWMADFDGEYAVYKAAAATNPSSYAAQITMGAKAVARSRAVSHELSVLSDYNKTFTGHRQKALPGHFVGESGKNIPILGHEGLVKDATDVIENATVMMEGRLAKLSCLANEGAAALQKASELDPQSGNPLALRAALLMHSMDDSAGAENLLQKAISMDKNCAVAHHLYAQIMGRRGEADASLLLLKKAARLAPGDPMVLCDLAVALKESGRREEGLAIMDRARGIVDAASGHPGKWELEQHMAAECDKY